MYYLLIALTLLQLNCNNTFATNTTSCHLPNPTLTPGKLCSSSDPHFDGYRYAAHLAHCRRHLTMREKDIVASRYGIQKDQYHLYEFDHWIPLSSGGSNDVENIFPQLLDEAKEKDKLELEIFEELKAGGLTQEQAVVKIKNWKPSNCRN